MAAAPDVDGQGQLLSTQTTLQTGDTQTLDNTGYCLLSLDGGGVRGLATLRVLQSIMTRLNNEREDAGLLPRKPCEIFDLIGGTSTGG
jgi:patatin-like phospholipase/acyl hydrolase